MATKQIRATDLKLIRFVVASIWLVTGIVVLFAFSKEESLSLISRIGLSGSLAVLTLYLGAFLDIVLGVWTLTRPGRLLWAVQGILIVIYTFIITLWLPEFWIHPFGPILKNIPILLMLWLLYKNEGSQE